MMPATKETSGAFKPGTEKSHRRTERLRSWLACRPKVSAALFYLLAISVLYAPVVFGNYSLQAPLYLPLGVTEEGAYGYEGREPSTAFNIDLPTPAYYEWPQNILVGNLYRSGELPLWNPYQAAGTPLAAQYSSRVFFPYQILENLTPVAMWDFFLLGRLWIAGFFTFLFLSLMGLSWRSSLLGGLVYMFSGTFVWFINLEQMANVAMLLPALMWTIEGLWHWRWQSSTVGVAVTIGLVLLAGQPEVAACVILLGALYGVFRIFKTRKDIQLKKLALGAGAGIIGIILAAPILLPFLEFTQNAHQIHPPGSTMGVQGTALLSHIPSLFVPTYFEVPVDFWPLLQNGEWDVLGGYVGVLPLVLIISGAGCALFLKKSRWNMVFFFFAIYAGAVLLKNFGSPLTLWLGRLPLLDQIWTPRWAGPTWTFAIAAAAALALEMIPCQAPGQEKPSGLWQSLAVFYQRLTGFLKHPAVIAVVALVLFALTYRKGISPTTGVIFAFIVFLLTVVVLKKHTRGEVGTGIIICLALLEMWFVIPRGYTTVSLLFKLLPAAAGIFAILALIRHRNRLAIAGAVSLIILFLAIDITAPSGFPVRYNPAEEAPYTRYLREHSDNYRVMGSDGVLMPNFASAMGIQDVRYINALTIKPYHAYVNSSLLITPLTEANSAGSLWFAGIFRNLWSDININKAYYSLLGVKYIVTSDHVNLDNTEIDSNLLRNAGFKERASEGPFESSAGNMQTAYYWFQNIQGSASFKTRVVTADPGGSSNGDTVEIDFTSAGGTGDFTQDMSKMISNYAGRQIKLSVNARTEVPGAAAVFLWSDTQSYHLGSFHSGSGQYETLTVKGYIPVNAKSLWVGVRLLKSAGVSISGVTVTIVDSSKESGSELALVYDNEVRIFENPGALPRAFMVYDSEQASSYLEAQSIIRQPGFDLRNRVALEEPIPAEYSGRSKSNSSVEIIDYRANKVTIRAYTEKPGIMVLTDTYYPGWEATVDGAPTRILRVDGLLRGVLLPAGEHTVIFQYFPDSFRKGFLAALVGLCLCAILFIYPILLKKKQSINGDDKKL